MVAASLHSNKGESYFVDSTYTPISKGVYALSEDGKIMDLFEPLQSKEQTIFQKWKCNDMCNIDEKIIFERFHNIIEEILKSKPEELIDFINRMDDCPRINLWNKLIKETKTSAEVTENCHCDFCEPKDTLTTWEKLKYPNESRIYVYCSRKNNTQNIADENIAEENITVENNMDSDVSMEQKMGHTHACYIDYPNNYSFSDVCHHTFLSLKILFLLCISSGDCLKILH